MTGYSCRPPRQEGQVVRGAGGLHADPGQVGIEVQVKPGGSSFQVTQQQVLHGIKTDGAQPEGVLHGVGGLPGGLPGGRKTFQKSQHLHEFPLAPPSHPGLRQTAQRSELFGELPSLQRSGLVQGRRLLLQPGQVVDGIEDEVVPFVGAGMSGNDLSAAADHHLSSRSP